MKLTINGNIGMSWVYHTAYEVMFQEKDRTAIVFARDTDNLTYVDRIKFNESDKITITIENMERDQKHD